MAHYAQKQGKSLIWLEIDISILDIKGVLYTDDVSNKSGVQPFGSDIAKKKLDIDGLISYLPFNEGDNWKRKFATYKYEILIPGCVPLEYIKNI